VKEWCSYGRIVVAPDRHSILTLPFNQTLISEYKVEPGDLVRSLIAPTPLSQIVFPIQTPQYFYGITTNAFQDFSYSSRKMTGFTLLNYTPTNLQMDIFGSKPWASGGNTLTAINPVTWSLVGSYTSPSRITLIAATRLTL
jgi:hypothetical protein